MHTDSGMVNTDSGKLGKSVHVGPELVFTLNQNRCSRSTGMGVHEGPEYAIETAMAVNLATGSAVWACLTAGLLEAVIIPDSVRVVRIMADKDRNLRGERAAGALAERLLRADPTLDVRILLPPLEVSPDGKGVDWLDVHISMNDR